MIVTFPPRVTQELEPGPADVRGETGYRLATDWLQTGYRVGRLPAYYWAHIQRLARTGRWHVTNRETNTNL